MWARKICKLKRKSLCPCQGWRRGPGKSFTARKRSRELIAAISYSTYQHLCTAMLIGFDSKFKVFRQFVKVFESVV